MKRILIVFFCFVIPGIIIGQEVFEHNIEVDPGKVINEACLSDLFESYRFVPLETRQDALIASLVKSVINDKTIYIQSRVGIKSRILVFSLETGKFIASVDRNGRGPGEYLIIYDFAVNSQGSIFVLAGKKIIKYKKSGEFDEEYKLKVSADMFICTSDGGFILSPPNYKHEIVILDKQLNINKCLFPHELYRIGYHDILQSVNKTVYYNRKNHGSYYYFLDSDAKPFIQIKFKGYKPNSKILENVIAESENGVIKPAGAHDDLLKKGFLAYLRINGTQLYGDILHDFDKDNSGDKFLFRYSIQTRKYQLYYKDKIVNNISGDPNNFRDLCITDKNEIICTIKSHKLLSVKKNSLDPELAKLRRKLNESSNPVIFIGKLKTF